MFFLFAFRNFCSLVMLTFQTETKLRMVVSQNLSYLLPYHFLCQELGEGQHGLMDSTEGLASGRFVFESWLLLPSSIFWAMPCSLYSAYKLNKQGDNIQPWRTPFPIWNQSVPCPCLTVASWPAYRFLKRQVRWSGIPISFRIFHSLWWSIQSKALA